MNRVKLNAIVDILAFFAGILSIFTGFILWLKFPHGERAGTLLYWGFTKLQWIDWHVWSSFILVALILLHLILHWAWIKNIKSILFN